MLRLDRTALKRALANSALFRPSLKASQWAGVQALLDAWDEFGDDDERKLANSLAQPYHETGHTMQPVRETFAKSDAQAIAALDRAWKAGRLGQVREPYWRDGWFGRGFIQLTHKSNYAKLGQRLGIDLVSDPAQAMDLKTSARIAVVGMVEGLFTGKKLSDYFGQRKNNPKGARAIVNGSDKATLIAGYHDAFLTAIKEAAEGDQDQRATAVRDAATIDAASSRGRMRSPVAEVAVQEITDPNIVLKVQNDLRALGYFSVGTPDGDLADMTKDAILTFRRRNGLPLRDTIDDELLAAIAKAKPKEVPKARAEASTAVIAERAPAVKQTLRMRLLGLWGVITGFVGTVISAISDWFDDVWEKMEPVRDTLDSVPAYAWFAIAAGVCLIVYLNSRSAVKETAAAYQEGRVL